MAFVRWTDITQFHNVRRMFTELDAAGTPVPGDHKVKYRAKVKLHGTNAAIQRLADGTIECQSRERVLSVDNDNDGFARWVASTEADWAQLFPGCVVFGEWCGPGILGGTSVSRIPKKEFCVFAAMELQGGAPRRLYTEPDDLRRLFPPGSAYILPWHEGSNIEVDWMQTPEALEPVTTRINALVEAVEQCDPWVKSMFGIEGTGEGLVFYPQGPHPSLDAFYARMFKAKGEAHRVVKTKTAVQVNPDVAASLEAFADLVLPEARLEQGAVATMPDGARFKYDTKRMGAFLGWINKDVAKETGAELAASGLDPKQAAKAVTDRARKWYLLKTESEA